MVASWQRSLTLAAVVVLSLVGLPFVGADQGGDARKELDKKIHKLLAETMDLGADTYNAGNREGCYQLYLGTLRTLVVVLDYRPDLQKLLDEKIKKAKSLPQVSDKAFALREGLDTCYETIGKDLGIAKAVTPKSLWDRLGGESAVRAVVKDFVASAAKDPKVNITRDGAFKLSPDVVKTLEQKLVELVSAVSGGPLKYTGRDMKTIHKGMGITDEEFNATAKHLVDTLNKFKVPAAEQKELLTIIGSTRSDIVEPKKKDDTKKTDDTKKDETKKDDTKKTDDTKKKDEPKKTLYERLGGEPAIMAVVDELVKKTAGNPKINFTRKGTLAEVMLDEAGVAKLKKHLVDMIGEATGGPQKYTGKDMKKAHVGMGITNEEFDALAGELKAVLDQFKVPLPEQAELLTIVNSTRAAIVEEKK